MEARLNLMKTILVNGHLHVLTPKDRSLTLYDSARLQRFWNGIMWNIKTWAIT